MNTRNYLILAALPLLLICRKAEAQYEKLDAYMERMEVMQKYTGTLLLGSDTKILYEKSFGPASASGDPANTARSAYRIGSVTKTLTATLVLKAEEAGLLKIDGYLDKWLPEVPNAAEITLRQMLSHTSGIASYSELSDIGTWKYRENSREEMLKRIAGMRPAFAPGAQYAYSNSNYYLLGMILEQAYNKDFEALLQSELFKPLSMNNSGISNVDGKANLSVGLHPTGQGWQAVPTEHPSVPFAAGAVYSTANDMHTFSSALFGGKLFANEASLESMKTPVIGDYGLGLFEMEIAGEPAVGHNGGIDGYSSMWMYLPGLELHLVSLSNNFITDHMAVAEAAVRVHKGEDIALPEARQAVMLPEELLRRYAGAYSLNAGFLLNVDVQNGALTCEVPGQDRVSLKAANDSSFFSEIYNLELVFHRSPTEEKASGLTLEQAGMKFTGTPFSLPDQMVVIEPQKLQGLVGVYEIQPGFDLHVSLEGGKLMARATGQSAFELLAEDETHFFATVAPIDIQFEMGEDGKAKAIALKQSGQVTYAERKTEVKDGE